MDPDLTAYVPTLIDEWMRDAPDASWRIINGTLVFVDISGFTSMSERLAKRGRVGAEEVTDVIGASFSRLLGSAYEESAQLLKFGGDALLLLFSGAGHASRACRAAFRMRWDLRSFGRFSTSAGLVSLKMSVGVHSGDITFVLAGGSHRELMVVGPAVTGVVNMEAAAQAGQILVSAATAEAIPRSCLGTVLGEGWLLKRPPAATTASPALAIGDRLGDVGPYLSVAIREHVASGVGESEHRQVTVAFLHFDGTDELLRATGPDAVAARLDALVRAVQAACREYDVCLLATDLDRDGGKIILTAGAPKSAGNDEERMLRALRSIAEHPNLLPLRIGVNCGHVFAGDIGPPFRRTYTVMGDAVNLAARLMAKSQPGQILATSAVLERSPTQFAVTELDPFSVKGKARPVSAWDVGAVRGSRTASHAVVEPIVGREQELATLLAAVRELDRRGTTLLEITGDAGIGKSRLVDELVARTTGIRCYRTSGQPYESSTAYFPFRNVLRALLCLDDVAGTQLADALRQRVSASTPRLLPWLPLIAAVIDVPVASTPEVDQLSPAFRRARLQQAVTDLVVELERGPALFVFEDAHLLDQASAELLRYLLANVTARPWLVCVTSRTGESASCADVLPSAVRLRLEPLSASASTLLTAAVLGDRSLVPGQTAALIDRAGGNPLFLRELVSSQADGGAIASMPDTLEALVVSRIDRLPAAERHLLRYASVFGPSFQPATLVKVAGDLLPPDVEIHLERMLGEFLVETEDGAFRFRHAVLQETAYESLSFRRRRDLHGRIGAYIEQAAGDDADARAELLSLHFLRAQDFTRAYWYSLTAGQRSKRKFANVEAAAFFRRAIHAAREVDSVGPGEMSAVYEALGDVEELAGSYADASAAFAGARAAIRRTEMVVPRLCWKEGVVRERLGRYSQAIRWYGRGMKALAGHTPESLQLRLAYAGVRFRQGRYAECARWCRGAVTDAASMNDRASLAHAYYLLSHACTFMGDPAGERFRNLALPIYEELGDLVGKANVLNNLGVAAYYEGRWNEALDYYRRSGDAREKAGDVVGAATASNNIGEILSDRGQLDAASELFAEALRTWRGSRYAVGVALAQSNLGRAASRAGRLDEGRVLLDEALAGFQAIGAGSFVLEVEARLAERHLLAGAYDLALQLTADATRHAEIEGMVALKAMIHRTRAYALMQAKRFGEARASLSESLEYGRAVNADYEVALTLQARASLAQSLGEDPEPYLAECVPIFERLGIGSTPLLAKLNDR